MESIEKTLGSEEEPIGISKSHFERAILEMFESLACADSYVRWIDRNLDIHKPNMQIDDSNIDMDENASDNNTSSPLPLYEDQPYELAKPLNHKLAIYHPSLVGDNDKDKADIAERSSAFWAWCHDDFLRDITEDDLEEFRNLFVDEFCCDFSSLMVNGKIYCSYLFYSPHRPIKQLTEELIHSICGTGKEDDQTQPPSSCYQELPSCSEEAGRGHFTASVGPYDNSYGSRHIGEGMSPARTAIARLTLPLRLPIMEFETREFTLPSDILVMNDSFTEESDEHSQMVCDDSDYDDYLNIIKEVDPEGIANLIRMGVIPEYFRAYCSEASFECSTEEKQISAGELDEVSAELLKCQQELDQLKPDLQVIVGSSCRRILHMDLRSASSMKQIMSSSLLSISYSERTPSEDLEMRIGPS